MRWRWSSHLTAWYLPRSRDAEPRHAVIAATAAALRAAGYDVQVCVDASSRTAADIEADKVIALTTAPKGCASGPTA